MFNGSFGISGPVGTTSSSGLTMGGDIVMAGNSVTGANQETFTTSTDSAAAADSVKIGGYDIAAGHRALAIGSEEVAVAGIAVASTHKYPVRINGVTYYILLSNV